MSVAKQGVLPPAMQFKHWLLPEKLQKKRKRKSDKITRDKHRKRAVTGYPKYIPSEAFAAFRYSAHSVPNATNLCNSAWGKGVLEYKGMQQKQVKQKITYIIRRNHRRMGFERDISILGLPSTLGLSRCRNLLDKSPGNSHCNLLLHRLISDTK
jgi:hypothetical protein